VRGSAFALEVRLQVDGVAVKGRLLVGSTGVDEDSLAASFIV
jgi:hypothetical protein